MEVNDLLMEQVLHSLREQGLKASRGAIYYLEKKDLIHPTFVKVGSRKKRFYSWADYRLITKAIRYTNMGITVDTACDLLMNPPSQYAWFLIRTQPGMACRFVTSSKEYKEVETAAAIWGSFYDALLKVGIWHRVDRDVLLFREFPRCGSIPGSYTVYELRKFLFSRADTTNNSDKRLLEAHLLIQVHEEDKEELADELSRHEPVVELAEVDGDMNLIARVAAENKKDLDRIMAAIMETSLACRMKTYLSITEDYITE